MAKCSNCGSELAPGAHACEQCGQPVAVGAGLPKFKLDEPGAPSLDFSLPKQGLGEVPGLEQVDLGKMDVRFGGQGPSRGRPYRPLFVIGQDPASKGRIENPFGVVRLPDRTMYIIDYAQGGSCVRVQKFSTATGEFIATVREFSAGGAAGEVDTPAGIAADDAGNFYIADMGSSCIRRYDPSGAPSGVFGSEGTGESQLMNPQDVDVDPSGNMLIADTGNNRILLWDAAGKLLEVMGINRMDEDGDWLKAGSEPGEFDEPQGVTMDDAGNVFVADSNNHRIQKLSAAGVPQLVFGEEGDRAGQLLYPSDLRVTAEGAIYVLDLNGRRIQRFSDQGQFVFEMMLPEDSGSVGDFDVSPEGHILVALRRSNVILNIEMI